ncbi:XTP/dITP diphosphatase [Desulfurivibrio alkaliphilus]|uniref:dITP/XTP pyrophosphatase n=1 Tax=Desulfurivibrio alkaliphilus (strain DSM 19089 / UNIQEM U267 / AHT2) TaxID=589865 RepID=D6Z5M2_DESAT|nr:XTP/dITP diphosphatase [Desulfurivibrio alkaliphilus]ADH86759.1 non-canonical purine NTP pyrophosphatase, rdgB/HAM1 family [Desulfurivibrio alkaliphilus AHT 2]
MKQIIVLATRNQGKVKELQQMLAGFPVDIRSLADFGPLPEVVEDGATFDDNAYKKALFTAKALGLPAMADDSGLEVAALDGAPGVYSARYAGEKADDAANIAKLLKEMEGKEDRRAAFVCVLSLAVPSGPALTYEGRCEGEITHEPKGSGGFGYDPVMFYHPLGKTFAEMTPEEKNQVSHRGQAMAQVREEFDKILKWLEQRLVEEKDPKPDHRQFEHNDWSREVMVK